jgi:hypothetical protein
MFVKSSIKTQTPNPEYIDYIYDYMFPLLLEINSRKLHQFCTENSFSKILFLSREGFTLQKAYAHWTQLRNLHPAFQSEYLFVSRRAINRCLIGTENFDEKLASYEVYEGTIEKLFAGRFSLTNQEIRQRFDSGKIHKRIAWGERDKMNLAIRDLHLACKKNPLADVAIINQYFKSQIDSDTLLVDIGFKGTMQASLSALLGLRLHGFYFYVTPDAWPGRKSSAISSSKLGNSIFRNSLLLEYLCSAPHGTVLRYEESESGIFPVLKMDNLLQEEFVLNNALKKLDFFVGFTDAQIEELFSASWWQATRGLKQLDQHARKYFEIEDDWSRGFVRNLNE